MISSRNFRDFLGFNVETSTHKKIKPGREDIDKSRARKKSSTLKIQKLPDFHE